jgi:hypothetical protein
MSHAVNAWPDWYISQYNLCVVASVGNYEPTSLLDPDYSHTSQPYAPASSMNTVAVGAITETDDNEVGDVVFGSCCGAVSFCDSLLRLERTYFKPELLAPGQDVDTLLPLQLTKYQDDEYKKAYKVYSEGDEYVGGNTIAVGGTSVAAPIVASGGAWFQL